MKHYTAQELIGFEERVKEAWEAGRLPFLLHLCGGNEKQLIEIFGRVQPGDWVFSGHRSHYHYLLSGGGRQELMEKIARGDSMFVFGKRDASPECMPVNFLTSSVLAGTCAIAAGVAWQLKAEGSKNKVWCFLGDGAEDEGHFYEAVRFVDGWDLPCTFVIEDNDRSVETDKSDRRGGYAGLMRWPSTCVKRYQYTPTYPHAGSGCRHQIMFDAGVVRAVREKTI